MSRRPERYRRYRASFDHSDPDRHHPSLSAYKESTFAENDDDASVDDMLSSYFFNRRFDTSNRQQSFKIEELDSDDEPAHTQNAPERSDHDERFDHLGDRHPDKNPELRRQASKSGSNGEDYDITDEGGYAPQQRFRARSFCRSNDVDDELYEPVPLRRWRKPRQQRSPRDHEKYDDDPNDGRTYTVHRSFTHPLSQSVEHGFSGFGPIGRSSTPFSAFHRGGGNVEEREFTFQTRTSGSRQHKRRPHIPPAEPWVEAGWRREKKHYPPISDDNDNGGDSQCGFEAATERDTVYFSDAVSFEREYGLGNDPRRSDRRKVKERLRQQPKPRRRCPSPIRHLCTFCHPEEGRTGNFDARAIFKFYVEIDGRDYRVERVSACREHQGTLEAIEGQIREKGKGRIQHWQRSDRAMIKGMWAQN